MRLHRPLYNISEAKPAADILPTLHAQPVHQSTIDGFRHSCAELLKKTACAKAIRTLQLFEEQNMISPNQPCLAETVGTIAATTTLTESLHQRLLALTEEDWTLFQAEAESARQRTLRKKAQPMQRIRDTSIRGALGEFIGGIFMQELMSTLKRSGVNECSIMDGAQGQIEQMGNYFCKFTSKHNLQLFDSLSEAIRFQEGNSEIDMIVIHGKHGQRISLIDFTVDERVLRRKAQMDSMHFPRKQRALSDPELQYGIEVTKLHIVLTKFKKESQPLLFQERPIPDCYFCYVPALDALETILKIIRENGLRMSFPRFHNALVQELAASE